MKHFIRSIGSFFPGEYEYLCTGERYILGTKRDGVIRTLNVTCPDCRAHTIFTMLEISRTEL